MLQKSNMMLAFVKCQQLHFSWKIKILLIMYTNTLYIIHYLINVCFCYFGEILMTAPPLYKPQYMYPLQSTVRPAGAILFGKPKFLITTRPSPNKKRQLYMSS